MADGQGGQAVKQACALVALRARNAVVLRHYFNPVRCQQREHTPLPQPVKGKAFSTSTPYRAGVSINQEIRQGIFRTSFLARFVVSARTIFRTGKPYPVFGQPSRRCSYFFRNALPMRGPQ